MKQAAKRQRRKKFYGGAEKRKHPRLTLNASLSFKIKKFPPPEKMIHLLDAMRKGPGIDVSESGVSFVTGQLLIPGSILEITVPKSPLGPARRKKAKVVWVREVEEEKYRIGVKFVR